MNENNKMKALNEIPDAESTAKGPAEILPQDMAATDISLEGIPAVIEFQDAARDRSAAAFYAGMAADYSGSGRPEEDGNNC